MQKKERELELLTELEEWDDKLEELNKPEAFADHGEELQRGFLNVAQYSDQWTKTATGSFRAWYICRQTWGDQHPPCATLMPSQVWTRRHDDPSVSQQRWYCVCCQTRYVTKFGMLVEFHKDGASTFMLADVSNGDVEDVRASYLQHKYKPATPAELYAKIPVVMPMKPDDVLRKVEPHEVANKSCNIDHVMKIKCTEKLNDVPKWNWDSLFVLFGDKPLKVD